MHAEDTTIGLAISHYVRGDVDLPNKQQISLSPHEQMELNPYNPPPSPSSISSTSLEADACPDIYSTPAPTAPGSRRVSMEEYNLAHVPDRPAPSLPDYALSNPSSSTSSLSTIPTPAPRPSRLSRDEFLHYRASSPSPPSYDSLLLARKPTIIPREEEGNEKLPPYTCDLALSAVFMQKHELENAVHRARDRTWRRVLVSLQGTALSLSSCSRPFFLSIPTRPDLACNVKRGALLKTYSLQHAEVGIAADYVKRRYVIRLRVEADQFLLNCTEIETHVAWLEALNAAIGVAPPLDDRGLPEENTLPRNQRRRRRRRHAQVVDEAEEATAPAAARDGGQPAEAELTEELETRQETEMETPPPGLAHHHSYTTSLSTLASATSAASTIPSLAAQPSRPATAYPSHLTAARHRSGRDPGVDGEGKWAPTHNWSPTYDLVYAKRCMQTLLSGSPRKSRFVIMKGVRWVVDWEGGLVERWVPGVWEGEGGLLGYEGGVVG